MKKLFQISACKGYVLAIILICLTTTETRAQDDTATTATTVKSNPGSRTTQVPEKRYCLDCQNCSVVVGTNDTAHAAKECDQGPKKTFCSLEILKDGKTVNRKCLLELPKGKVVKQSCVGDPFKLPRDKNVECYCERNTKWSCNGGNVGPELINGPPLITDKAIVAEDSDDAPRHKSEMILFFFLMITFHVGNRLVFKL